MTSALFRCRPVAVAAVLPLRRRRRLGRIAVQPARDVVVVELLAPEQAGERLALTRCASSETSVGMHRRVERVRLARGARRGPRRSRARTASAGFASVRRSRIVVELACRHVEPVAARPPSCRARRVHGAASTPWTTCSWKASFTYGPSFSVPNRRRLFVSFSVKSSSGAPFGVERAVAVRRGARSRPPPRLSARRPVVRAAVARRVPTTTCCGTRASAAGGVGAASGPRFATRDPHEDVVGRGLRVLDEDVEVAVLVEDAGVEQLELRLPPCRAARFSSTQPRVRELALRILVEHLHVRVRRRGVEVEVVLLHVLAVVALGAGQAEEALLQDRIAAVPERQREAEARVAVADAGEAVLAPAVGARARVSCGK